MADLQNTKPAQYEPRRDQPMPQYSYSPVTAQAHSVTVRSVKSGGLSQGMVLVNGKIAY